MNGGNSERSFLNGLLNETARLVAEFKKNYDEVQQLIEQNIAFEDLPIASTYPRELFEEEAKRLGIDIDAVGEQEAIKQIVMLQFEGEKEKSGMQLDEKKSKT